jgi:hypothetical protein
VSGAVGGRFAYACPEGLSAACRSAEWRLALPPHHYIHVAAGIVEFATATIAVYLAWQRTRPVERPTTRAVRWTGRTLVVAYPLLGLAYLTDRLGALTEPIFFICFSVMAMVELAEPVLRRPGGRAPTRTDGGSPLATDDRPPVRVSGPDGSSASGSGSGSTADSAPQPRGGLRLT